MRAPLIIAAAGCAAMPIFSGPAWGAANRTFVSGLGLDTNDCSFSHPCRSFAGALTQTNAGGEITVLDPAGYGTVTITKSVSIVNDGVGEVGITTVDSSNAITVTIGAGDVVNLRGLTLVGGGVGANGIQFNNLGTLNVQNCVIRGFFGDGITASPTGTAQLNIADTIISNVGFDAVQIAPFSGANTVTATFNRVQAIGTGDSGLWFSGSSGALNVTIANSTASNNPTNGIVTQASGPSPQPAQVMVVNSVIANNGTGVSASGNNSTIYLARNVITANTTAFAIGSGALSSFGDNDIKGNGDDGGAITPVSTK